MKKGISILLILIFSFGCSAIGSKKNMSEDPGSPEKAALLRERVEESWSAFVKQDFEKVYESYDPFYRAKGDKPVIIATMNKLKYHKFEIKDIKIEGNIAVVKLKVELSMAKTKYKRLDFEVPKTEMDIEDKWLFVYDNWYKEWYSEMMEAGIAVY